MFEITNDNLSKEIYHKIKLFSNEKYFKLFAHILTEKSKNFSAFKNISSLALSMDNLAKEKELKKLKKLNKTKIDEKRNKFSPWFYLMMYICNIKNKKKFIKLEKNALDIDPIIFAYMVNFCKNKVKLLNNLSIHRRLKLNNLVKFYLDLCSYNILLKKEINSKNDENDEENNIIYNDNDYSRRRTGTIRKINMNLENDYQITKRDTKLRLNNYLESKSIKNKKTINYSNSFTRLFIGETDQKSLRERYISYKFIKNFCDLKLFNKKINLKSLCIKKLYNELSQKEDSIDSGMNIILNKFKQDSKMVENYKKHSKSLGKKEKNFDKDKEDIKEQFKNNMGIYIKPLLKKNKISTFPQGEPLMNFNNSRDKLNIDIRRNKSRNIDFDFSSDLNRGFSQQYSKNLSTHFKSFRMSLTNNAKNNSNIYSKLSKNNLKINLKYSSLSRFRLRTRRNHSNNSSDILINIKTKLNKGNDYHFNIAHKKFKFKSSLNNELSLE